METLNNILKSVNPDVDYYKETRLIEDRVLDSVQIVYLITLISEEYSIEISPEDLLPENFNSMDAIYALIKRYEKWFKTSMN